MKTKKDVTCKKNQEEKKTRCKIAKGFCVAKDSRLKEPKNI